MFVICTLFLASQIFAAEINSACRTPNGENGTCIPVTSCRPILLAVSHLDKDAIDFARVCQCGLKDNKPLLCCGSVGTLTFPPSATTSTTLPSIELNTPSIATPINHFLLPDRSLCGLQVPEFKSPNGAAESMEVPWLAALKYTKEDGTPAGYKCTGSLINTQYILTAAQCLSLPGYNLTEVRLGEWKFSTPRQCISLTGDDYYCKFPVTNVKVAQKISHPYHNIYSGNNDIGLIRLERFIIYNDFIRPICLPPSDYLPPEAGTLMDTAGWALTETGAPSDVKLKRQLAMVGPEACNTSYSNYLQAFPNKACVSTGTTKLCNGDSGSPLMRRYVKEHEFEEDQWFQEGILYKRLGCEPKKKLEFYTRVSRYIHWILEILGERGTKCVTPNEEDGTCIDVLSCRPIVEAIATKDKGAYKFAKDSSCGRDTAPLVCCGTKGYYNLPSIFDKVFTDIPPKVTKEPEVTTSTTTETDKQDATTFTNKLPDRTVCGFDHEKSRVQGGTDTEPGEFPWMAALEYRSKVTGQNAGVRCGGTVINNRYILTAAHCILNQKFEMVAVRLGEWKLSTDPDCVTNYAMTKCSDKVVKLKIKETFAHPFYSLRTGDNDIGLIQLDGDITFTDNIRPICLPQVKLPPPDVGTKLTLSGWGATENGTSADVKQKVAVPLITNTNCHQKTTTKRKASANDQLCAGGEEGKDSCNGDSGGPLMRPYEDYVTQEIQWYQEGVVSYGVGCGRAGSPAIYTRVNRYLTWIINNIKRL